MKYQVEVTLGDIAAGCKFRSNNCPLALALNRATGFITFVSQGGADFFISLNPSVAKAKEVQISIEARQFITKYDSGQQVSPFSFELEIPDV